MHPKIKISGEKKLVGKRLKMNLANNTTVELWRSFMPRRKEITNALSKDLFSLEVYDAAHFESFAPEKEFEKWALIEVSDFEQIPVGMESLVLPGGLYAVFDYKGSSADTSLFEYIFKTWLPNSEYLLDQRPHFCIMGEKYKNADPDSEEEIWIPVRLNTQPSE
jgi:AraC family transcriptional regulator